MLQRIFVMIISSTGQSANDQSQRRIRPTRNRQIACAVQPTQTTPRTHSSALSRGCRCRDAAHRTHVAPLRPPRLAIAQSMNVCTGSGSDRPDRRARHPPAAARRCTTSLHPAIPGPGSTHPGRGSTFCYGETGPAGAPGDTRVIIVIGARHPRRARRQCRVSGRSGYGRSSPSSASRRRSSSPKTCCRAGHSRTRHCPTGLFD